MNSLTSDNDGSASIISNPSQNLSKCKEVEVDDNERDLEVVQQRERREVSLVPWAGEVYELVLCIYGSRGGRSVRVRNHAFFILTVSIMQDPKAEIVKNFKVSYH